MVIQCHVVLSSSFFGSTVRSVRLLTRNKPFTSGLLKSQDTTFFMPFDHKNWTLVNCVVSKPTNYLTKTLGVTSKVSTTIYLHASRKLNHGLLVNKWWEKILKHRVTILRKQTTMLLLFKKKKSTMLFYLQWQEKMLARASTQLINADPNFNINQQEIDLGENLWFYSTKAVNEGDQLVYKSQIYNEICFQKFRSIEGRLYQPVFRNKKEFLPY